MKQLIYIVMVLFLASCDDFLKEDPKTVILQEDYLRNEANVTSALYGIYTPLSTSALFAQYLPMIDVGTDMVATKGGNDNKNAPFSEFSFTSNTEWINSTGPWKELWRGIVRCNYIINEIDENLSEEFRAASIAEARCMRAYYYYNLVRIWGDVPIIKWYVESDKFEATADMARSSADNVYNELIIPDLIYAAEYAPSIQDKPGRVTKWFARTLLAEAYMTMAGWRANSVTGVIEQGDSSYWAKALEAAKSIVDNPDCSFRLITEGENPYASIWEQEFTSEALLEVGFIAENGMGSQLMDAAISQQTGNGWWGGSVHDTPPGFDKTIQEMKLYYSGSGKCVPTPELFHSFAPEDKRKWGIFTRYTKNAGTANEINYLTRPAFTKYIDYNFLEGVAGVQINYADVNFVVYRYADALMILAEAENEVNGATSVAREAINQVRRRAGLGDVPASVSQEELREIIYLERALEFHAEGKRRFDLVRWNKFKEFTKVYDMVYYPEDNPIPADIIAETGTTRTSYMTAVEQIYMHIPDSPARGCTTVTEAPYYAYLLPLPANELERTNWVNNYGY